MKTVGSIVVITISFFILLAGVSALVINKSGCRSNVGLFMYITESR